MSTGEFDVGVALRWTSIPFGGKVQILLVAACYRNRDKLRPPRWATWLLCRLYQPFLPHSSLMVCLLCSASSESASSPSLTFFTSYIWLFSIVVFSDVDECTVGSHFCDDICHNTLGSFTCHCRSGYRLMTDLRTCLGTETIRFVLYTLDSFYISPN